MSGYIISESTTFWSQDALVQLVREQNLAIELEEVNQEFDIYKNITEAWNTRWILRYGRKETVEFGLSGAMFY